MVTNFAQCCQRRDLPAKLGYLKTACRRSKSCWAASLKLGYFSSEYLRQLFFPSNLPVSCQFREFLSLFNVQEHSFHHFQGLRRSRRAVNMHYPLHAEVNNLIVFPPNWVILIILQLKSTQIWEVGCMIILDRNWVTLKSLAAGKKGQFAAVWCSEVWQHWLY